MVVTLIGITGQEISNALDQLQGYGPFLANGRGDDKVEIWWKFDYDPKFGFCPKETVEIHNYKNGPRYTGDDSVDLMKLDRFSVECAGSIERVKSVLEDIFKRNLIVDEGGLYKCIVTRQVLVERLREREESTRKALKATRKRLKELTDQLFKLETAREDAEDKLATLTDDQPYYKA